MLFVKPDISVIERIIYYSTLTREARLTLFQLRKTIVAIRGLKFTVPNYTDLNDVEIQLIRRIAEIQNSSRLLLEPLLEGKDFGHKYLNNWIISISEIEQGFCAFEEIKGYKDAKPYLYGNKYILLLRDYVDKSIGKFYGGSLISLTTAEHFINDIPKLEVPTKGLYNAVIKSIELALRQNISKPLSNE